MNWYFLFPLTELEILIFPFLLIAISGILSPCLQQWLVPPFPLSAKILDQPCLPLPFTLEWMIRSKLTLNSGPQLSIVPISLFLLMSPASSIDKHSLAILSSLCSFWKSIVYAMTSSYIPLQETDSWVSGIFYLYDRYRFQWLRVRRTISILNDQNKFEWNNNLFAFFKTWHMN